MKYIQVTSARSASKYTLFLKHIVCLSAEPDSETTVVRLTNGEAIIVDMKHSVLLSKIKSEINKLDI